jgi:hypothetical protein
MKIGKSNKGQLEIHIESMLEDNRGDSRRKEVRECGVGKHR